MIDELRGLERLTEDGPTGIRAFCLMCNEKPLVGKCSIGNECFSRQIFKRLALYETHVPALLDELARLQSELADMRERLSAATPLSEAARQNNRAGWVAVESALPFDRVPVPVSAPDGLHIAWLDEGVWWEQDGVGAKIVDGVTHWCMVPKSQK
jgi:hypothetical protein